MVSAQPWNCMYSESLHSGLRQNLKLWQQLVGMGPLERLGEYKLGKNGIAMSSLYITTGDMFNLGTDTYQVLVHCMCFNLPSSPSPVRDGFFHDATATLTSSNPKFSVSSVTSITWKTPSIVDRRIAADSNKDSDVISCSVTFISRINAHAQA